MRRTLFIMCVLVASTTMLSQDVYHTFLEEGKVWTYHYQGPNGQSYDINRFVDSDTIIGEKTYKIIRDNVGGQYQYALREEGQKVYIVYDHEETPSLLYDFGKGKGDIIHQEVDELSGMVSEQRVTGVDTIDIDGLRFRRLQIWEMKYDTQDPINWEEVDVPWQMASYWIEGVGSESLLETSFRQPGNYYNFKSCQINGRNYTQQELLKEPPQTAYRPFVEDGKAWVVKVYPDIPPFEPLISIYYFDGDTIIGGHTCKQMKYISHATEENWVNGVFTPANHLQYYMGACYEEDKKVYFMSIGLQQFRLLYDFSLSTGDVIKPFGEYLLDVNKVSDVIPGFKGVYYELWCGNELMNRWFEGVGSESLPYINYPWAYVGGGGVLLACCVGDEVIYYNSEEEDPYIMGTQKRRFDFTHTTKEKPKFPMRRGAKQSIYGEYNDLKLDINLEPIDDTYLVSITDASGYAVYEKAINAGNIVGLNIDISAYAKGRYTVTVENSYESFIGEFEIQTTGIKENVIIENLKDGSIYNLQGQRLNALQKGVNIVNGQKVFVR